VTETKTHRCVDCPIVIEHLESELCPSCGRCERHCQHDNHDLMTPVGEPRKLLAGAVDVLLKRSRKGDA